MTTPPIGLGPATSAFSVGIGPAEPWPEPEIPGHEVAPDFLGKSAVVAMAKLATDNGWTVKVTHAKGCYPSTGGKPSPPRDSLAVRMWKGDRRAVAVYVAGNKTWDWKMLRAWMVGMFPFEVKLLVVFEAMLRDAIVEP